MFRMCIYTRTCTTNTCTPHHTTHVYTSHASTISFSVSHYICVVGEFGVSVVRLVNVWVWCGYVCVGWCVGVGVYYSYSTVLVSVAPLEQELSKANKSLERSAARVGKLKKGLDRVDSKVCNTIQISTSTHININNTIDNITIYNHQHHQFIKPNINCI